MVQDAFHNGFVNPRLLETLVVLIPKVASPTSLKDLHPISLCNVAYKVVTKVLVSRWCPYLSDLIGPLQSSFIPGRETADNVILAQEVMPHIHKSKQKKGVLAFKVDLEKAYDRVSWEFLEQTLADFGFPASIVKMVMWRVRNGSISLFGMALAWTLSPQLGASDNVNFLSSILDDFCQASGMKVNVEKSNFICSKSFSNVRKRSFMSICGMRIVSNLENYLGIPLVHGKVRRTIFNPLIEKIQRRMSSWKSNLLNKVGRICLAKSVSTAVPIYTMQIMWLPRNVCNEMDKMTRNFIWGGDPNKRSLNLVNWEVITRNKKYGGLGIRDTRMANVSLLGKLTWDLLQGSNKIWCKVLTQKYISDGCLLFVANKCSSSPVWKGIVKATNMLKSGFSLHLGDGDLLFWYDNWSCLGLLCTMAFVQFIILSLPTIPITLGIGMRLLQDPIGKIQVTSGLRAMRSRDPYSQIGLGFGGSMYLKSRCNSHTEDLLHILRDFGHSSSLWHRLGFSEVSFWDNDSCLSWLETNARCSNGRLFLAGVCSSIDPPLPPIHWCRPKSGWVKVNVDNSCSLRDHSIRDGGVIRNDDGFWISGFSTIFGIGSSIQAELLAIEFGLKLAWTLGYRKIILESDCLEVIHIISGRVQVCLERLAGIILSISGLLERHWEVLTHHILREGNSVADFLAKLSLGPLENSRIWNSPPAEILSILQLDVASLT
ncbi:PREDICTED: uncharacterized protein LOC109327691 [Lupinus angustifolius]|uniref:uncharacterized protein LOC109327691 n=1 Tax=Lupinus angustifolius TaxID=3871 RepID=UPI00092E4E2D|nr:PREDICTED: uncharacterized protein LOC109327691 [Lupinus angustifolius]